MGGIAMVSGAGATAGETIAGHLADEGYDVAVLGPSEDVCAPAVDRARRSGRQAMALPIRAGDADSVQRAVDRVEERLGPPALLVNVVDATLSVPLSEAADWEASVGGALRQTFLISQAVLDLMIREGGGRIVVVADVLGGVGSRENTTVRAALEGFVRTLALEAEAFGVTANLVVAGLGVRAPSAAEILPAEPVVLKLREPAMAAPEFAATMAFLAADAAAIVSGQIIHVAADGMI